MCVVWSNVHEAASVEHSQFQDAVGGTTRCMEEKCSVEGVSEVRDGQRDIDMGIVHGGGKTHICVHALCILAYQLSQHGVQKTCEHIEHGCISVVKGCSSNSGTEADIGAKLDSIVDAVASLDETGYPFP